MVHPLRGSHYRGVLWMNVVALGPLLLGDIRMDECVAVVLHVAM